MESQSKILEVIEGGLLRQQGHGAFGPDVVFARELSPTKKRAINSSGVKLRLATP